MVQVNVGPINQMLFFRLDHGVLNYTNDNYSRELRDEDMDDLTMVAEELH